MQARGRGRRQRLALAGVLVVDVDWSADSSQLAFTMPERLREMLPRGHPQGV